MSKMPDVIALRALRKASHLANRILHKGGYFMGRVEKKATRLINRRTGTAGEAVPIDSVVAHAFYQMTPIFPALPAIGQKPAVVVFAFLAPRGFYGGIATLLRVAGHLADKLGHDLKIVQTTGFSKETAVLDFLAEDGIVIPESRFINLDASTRHPGKPFNLPLHPDDIVVVSAWWDAHVASLLPLQRKFLYLLQDYEPIFYNNSDSSVFATQTYLSEKFVPLCNTQLLYDFFSQNGYGYIKENGTWFEPAPVPKSAKPQPQKRNGGRRSMFIYGRPDVHRNLYYNALRAVNLAMKDERLEGTQWDLFSAGQADLCDVRLDSGHIIKNFGKLPMNEYYRFASNVDVALSPMLAPHPNYPTLELAFLGAMVVTTKYANKQDLSRYSQNILMAGATTESMAEKLVEAMLTCDEVRLDNLKHTTIGNDWGKALDEPLNRIIKRYRS
jgi:hypothetical protein